MCLRIESFPKRSLNCIYRYISICSLFPYLPSFISSADDPFYDSPSSIYILKNIDFHSEEEEEDENKNEEKEENLLFKHIFQEAEDIPKHISNI